MKRIVFLILCINIALVYAQEEPAETSSTLILNVYLEESGKALVTGYLESQEMLSGLPFIEKSEYIFQNDTNQLYAITDLLTSKQAEKWTLNFSLGGYYTEYNVIFYFPPKTALTKIDLSQDLNYFLKSENDSIVLSTQGFGVASPSVFLNYQQLIEERYPKAEYTYVLLLAGAVLILFALLFRRKREIQIEKKEIQPSSEMQKVIETLSENEKVIVNALLKEGGKLTQAKIRRETGIAKSSLSGILNALQRKNMIKKREYGRTNLIELSSWFLSEKEVK
ncbi:MAG: MarR family transcriptional regulator [Methanobacteriota archaeon]